MVAVMQRLSEYFGIHDWSKGVFATLRGLQPAYQEHPELFPYRSLADLYASTLWPSGIEYVGNYPSNRENGWSEQLNGVAYGEGNWFFTQRKRLWRFPLWHDLNDYVDEDKTEFLNRGIPGSLKTLGYDHFGDVDFYQGRLLVPVEHKSYDKTSQLATFHADDLDFLGSSVLETYTDHAGWCAVVPQSGALLSSTFKSVGGAHPVWVYSLSEEPSGLLKPIPMGALHLKDEDGYPLDVKRVQGGAVAPSGHLYLVSDVSSGGLMGFDLVSGVRQIHVEIEYVPGSGTKDELEGMVILPVMADESPGIPRSQIHIAMIDNDYGDDDDVYFKHFAVPEEQEALI